MFTVADDAFHRTIDKMTHATQSVANTITDRAIAPLTSPQVTFFQNWLQAHPTMERLVQILNWATDRPIVSLIILLFLIAIAWSLIKSIGRLFESFWLLVLKIPFKLSYFFIQLIWRSLNKLSTRLIPIAENQTSQMQVLPFSNIQSDRAKQHQRLSEIATQLSVLSQEQNQLIEEALTILSSNQIDSKDIPEFFQHKMVYEVNRNGLQS